MTTRSSRRVSAYGRGVRRPAPAAARRDRGARGAGAGAPAAGPLHGHVLQSLGLVGHCSEPARERCRRHRPSGAGASRSRAPSCPAARAPPRAPRAWRRGPPRASRSASSSARLRAGPMPGQVVEDRRRHRAVAARAVVGDREAVRLVAHALQQLQLGRVVRRARSARAARARRPPRCAWPARRPSTPRSRKPSQRAQAGRELARAAVDDDQVGQRRERLVALGVVRARGPAGSPTAPAAAPSTSSIAAKSSGTPSSRPRTLKRR